MKEAALGEACPACSNICNCTACLRSDGVNKKDLQTPDLELSNEDRLLYSRHIIKVLLPLLKQMVAVDNPEREERDKLQALPANEVACSCLRSPPGFGSEKAMVLKAACRQGSQDNYLYCLTAGDPDKQCLKHFQWHLHKGEPVIAHEVLRGMSGLSWEPSVMWRACRQNKKNGSLPDQDFDIINCSNWCQEKIKMHQFLQGYGNGLFDGEGLLKFLKLEDWPSSGSFRERLPRQYLEFLRCLPFKHYTHPDGCFNMKSLHTLLKLDMRPKMCIGYGVDQDLPCCSVTTYLLSYSLKGRHRK